MKPRLKFFVFWLLPILTALAFEVWMADFRPLRWYNVAENVLFAIAMLLTVPLFNSKKAQRFLVDFYYLVFVFCLFFESAFFYLFNTIFNASSIYIVLETNPAEIREFLGFYLDISVIGYFLVMMLLAFSYLAMPKKQLLKKHDIRVKVGSGALFVGVLAFLRLTDLLVPNLPYLTLKATWDYVEEQQRMANIDIAGETGNFQNVICQSSTEKSLYVLIIGESTARKHMGIYGYYRNTSPKLSEIKDELFLYQNVISSHTHTIASLKDVLTLYGFKKEKESSVVQLMNQAGFKTFWFSNQRPLGQYDSFTTKIAQASDVLKFSNSATTGETTNFDEALLPYFEEALKDPADKKFIVLHILGTHVNYAFRYPKDFGVFTESPRSRFKDELALTTINQYDNAVIYNDYFVRKVIEKTRSQQLSSYVLYFSDHGEEVYQSRYFSGHTEANSTKNMYQIPFILWCSEKFMASNPVYTGNLEAPYVLDDFIYSLADLSEIHFSEMKEEKSIFSKNFKPKKRIVGEGIDFDITF